MRAPRLPSRPLALHGLTYGTAAHANTPDHGQWGRPGDDRPIGARGPKSHRGIYLRLTPAARIVPVRGKCRLICCYCLPVPVRPLWHFLRCDIPLRDQPQRPSLPNTNRSQVNRQDAPNVIWVSVLRRAIGYAAGKAIKGIRLRICGTVPVGGINMRMPNGRPGRPNRNNAGRARRQRYTVSHADGHFVPPDPGPLLSRRAAFALLTYCRLVLGRITISRSSGREALMRHPRDSAPAPGRPWWRINALGPAGTSTRPSS